MNVIRRVLFLVLLLCMAMAGTALAQVASLQIRDINTEGFPNVRVAFEGRDNNGVPLQNVTGEQVTVLENGQQREVLELTSEVNPETVLSLAIVMDVTGSVEGEPLENAKQAVKNLLGQLNEKDRVALITVRPDSSVDPADLNPERDVGFTVDRNQVVNVVDFIQIYQEPTALYNAIFKAIRLTARETGKNRAVIVMSDGRNLIDGAVTADDTLDEANRNSLPVFTIALGAPADRDDGYMERLAVRTGGTFKGTSNPAELDPLFQDIVTLQKQQFVLTYPSGLSPGQAGEQQLALSIAAGGALPLEAQSTFTLAPDGQAEPTEEVPPTEVPSDGAEADATEVPAEATEEPVEDATEEPVEEATEEPSTEPTEVVPGTEDPSDDGEESFIDQIRDNPLPVIAIAIILLLLIVALIVAIMMRGRKRDDDAESESWAASAPGHQPLTQLTPGGVDTSADPNAWAGPSADPNAWAGQSADPNAWAGQSADPNAWAGQSADPNAWAGPSADPNVGGQPADPNFGPLAPTAPAGGLGMGPATLENNTPGTDFPPTDFGGGGPGTVPASSFNEPTASPDMGGAPPPSQPSKTVIFTRELPEKDLPYLIRIDDQTRFTLSEQSVRVGRSPDNTIHLADETVSGRHGVLTRRDGKVLIRDTGSTNGTFVNEQRVQGEQRILNDGDMVRFGKVELEFKEK